MNRQLLAALSVLIAGCAAAPSQKGVDPGISGQLTPGRERKPAASSVEQALIPPLRMEMPQVDGKPMDARFDLSVSDAPAAQVFNSLAAGTRYSMLVHPRVTGNISVNLKDVTIQEALDSIRELFGYEYRIDGTRIFIQPAGVQTRVFQVNYLSGQRRGVSQLRVISNSVADTPSSSGSTGTGTAGTSATTSTTTGVGGIGGAGAGQFGILTAPGGTGREGSRIITNQEATFWSDLCEALVALTFPDSGGAGVQPGQTGSTFQQQPEDRQRSICNRRHAASDRSIVVTPISGVVVVRALPAELRAVENYLRASRVSVERQVMLEAKIIEVTLNSQFQSGINWSIFANRQFSAGQVSQGTLLQRLGSGNQVASGASAITGSPGNMNVTNAAFGANPGQNLLNQSVSGGLFGLALQTPSFAALLSFLETQGNVQVLSSPRVAAINNQKAVLKVGDEQMFVTRLTVTPGTPGGAGVAATAATVSPDLSAFFSGIVLDVTPQIDGEGTVTLHVHPSINTVNQVDVTVNAGNAGTVSIPTARSTLRETDTIVRVTDGLIVAIGGLMRTEVNDVRSGLPGLMDSAVGWLFRNTNRFTEKKELVILIKPTIIDSDRAWANDLRETQQRLEGMNPPTREGR
jgi:MSHA biogenesis protein MshL